MPSTIEQVHREHKDRGLSILAVNIEEDREKVAAWAKEKKLSVPVVLDPSGALTRAYQVTATPTVLLVARNGTLIGKALGNRPWTGDKGRALIQALLGP